MMSNKEWLAFFRNIKNKQYILNLFVNYLCKLPSQLNQVNYRYWLATKMKHSKSQVVSQKFLNVVTKKPTLEGFSMHSSKMQM